MEVEIHDGGAGEELTVCNVLVAALNLSVSLLLLLQPPPPLLVREDPGRLHPSGLAQPVPAELTRLTGLESELAVTGVGTEICCAVA